MNTKIKIVMTKQSWIESNAIENVKKVASLEGIISAVGLPDLHVGKMPVGVSYITKDIIYPAIIGNDIGCGMSLFETDIKKIKFGLSKIRKRLEKIETIENISIEHLIEENFPFKDKLGSIGSGNHFAEFQEIEKIYDEKSFKEINMNKNNVFLLVHSGSRGYGQFILEKYIKEYHCQNGLKKDSEGFNTYLKDHDEGVQFGIKNRELIAYRILRAIGEDKKYKKILDSIHNSITKKIIKEEDFYIHRKGAAPSDVGYVVVAGSRGSFSYIVKPKENLLDYAFSISHGSGRKWGRVGCKEKLESIYTKKSVRKNNLGTALICKDKHIIYEEAPQAYKNIERVIKDMIEENMISIVATLKPLLTYKI